MYGLAQFILWIGCCLTDFTRRFIKVGCFKICMILPCSHGVVDLQYRRLNCTNKVKRQVQEEILEGKEGIASTQGFDLGLKGHSVINNGTSVFDIILTFNFNLIFRDPVFREFVQFTMCTKEQENVYLHEISSYFMKF